MRRVGSLCLRTTQTHCVVRLNNEELENVRNFTYLGAVVNKEGSLGDELYDRT